MFQIFFYCLYLCPALRYDKPLQAEAAEPERPFWFWRRTTESVSPWGNQPPPEPQGLPPPPPPLQPPVEQVQGGYLDPAAPQPGFGNFQQPVGGQVVFPNLWSAAGSMQPHPGFAPPGAVGMGSWQNISPQLRTGLTDHEINQALLEILSRHNPAPAPTPPWQCKARPSCRVPQEVSWKSFIFLYPK